MKLTPKQITLIIMCALLVVTLVMAVVVIAKVAPIFGALLGGSDGTTVPTTVPSTVPPTTTKPNTQPSTTQPTTVPPTTVPPTTVPVTTIPGHVHAFTELVEEHEVSCTENGFKLYACECGETEQQDVVEATGHRFGPGKLISPSCTENGYTEKKCSVCGEVEQTNLTDPLDHDFVLTEEKEASCLEGGYCEYTCQRDGCGETKREDEVEALGHDWQKGEIHKPTCDEEGYTEYICGNEGCEEVKREEPTAALGHSYGDWQLTREPVEGVNGQLTSKCTNEGCDSQQVRDTELQMLPMVEKTELCYSYTVELRAKNSAGKNVTVYTYQVDDYGFFEDIEFLFDGEFGLLVTFTDPQGVQQQYALTDSNTLSINTDGKLGKPKVLGNSVGDICYSYELETYDGGTFSVEQSRGKVTVLMFWGNWDERAYSALQTETPRLTEEYGDKVQVVAVHTHSDYGKQIPGFVEENGLDASAIYCRDDSGEEYYNMLGCDGRYPYLFILDEEGVIVQIIAGTPTYWDMQKVVESVLAE